MPSPSLYAKHKRITRYNFVFSFAIFFLASIYSYYSFHVFTSRLIIALFSFIKMIVSTYFPQFEEKNKVFLDPCTAQFMADPTERVAPFL